MPDSLDQLFSLYRASFPQNERRTETDLRAAMSTPAYRVLKHEVDGLLIAFAILFVPPAKSFALLEYLAVQPRSRSGGIGGELIRSAIRQIEGRSLLSEVESDPTSATVRRRQEFYQRCGFAPVEGLKYQLPLPGNPPPMELWIHPQKPCPIGRDTLSEYLTTIYTGVYGCSASDPRIEQMLASQRF